MRPHHALGVTGGSAGVEDPKILTGALDAGSWFVVGDNVLVANGPVRRRVAANLDPQLNAWQLTAYIGETFGQRRIEEDRLGIAVVDQVPKLGLDISIVHVARRRADLEGGEFGLEVLIAVVHGACHIVAGSDTGSSQSCRKSRRPVIELSPGAACVGIS